MISIKLNSFHPIASDYFTYVVMLIDHESCSQFFNAVSASGEALIQIHIHLEMLV